MNILDNAINCFFFNNWAQSRPKIKISQNQKIFCLQYFNLNINLKIKKYYFLSNTIKLFRTNIELFVVKESFFKSTFELFPLLITLILILNGWFLLQSTYYMILKGLLRFLKVLLPWKHSKRSPLRWYDRLTNLNRWDTLSVNISILN